MGIELEIKAKIIELIRQSALQTIQGLDALEYHTWRYFEIVRQIEETILKLNYGEAWKTVYEKESYKYKKRKIIEHLREGKAKLNEFSENIEWYTSEIDNLLIEGCLGISKVYLLMLKAIILTYGRKLREARETLMECIELDPGNKYALHLLASIYYKLNYPNQALEILDKLGDDPLALKTKLEIYTELCDIENGEKIYKKLQNFINETHEKNLSILLSIKFACIRYQAEKIKLLGNAEERDIDQMYEDLISSIPDELREMEPVFKNSYASYLIESGDRKKKEKGLKILKEVSEQFPWHTPSMDKICSTMLKEDFRYIRENQANIRNYIKRILEVDALHYPALLYNAELEAKATIWEAISEEVEFWKKSQKVYSMFQEALEPNGDELSFHNMIVHFATGCFLWHIEKTAYRKGYKNNCLPSADSEFIKSLNIAEKFREEDRLTKKVREHLVLVNGKLGEYLIVAKKDENGYSFLEKAWNLSREMKIPFRFYSKNRKVQAFIDLLSFSSLKTHSTSASFIEKIETLLKMDPYSMFLGKKVLSIMISYLHTHSQDNISDLIMYFILLLERYADAKDEVQERHFLFFRKSKKIYKVEIDEVECNIKYEYEIEINNDWDDNNLLDWLFESVFKLIMLLKSSLNKIGILNMMKIKRGRSYCRKYY
jgi:tetratricopeptide (TPR) repeat protein